MGLGRGSKLGNEYARATFDAPKTVWQAIAFGLAMRLTDEDHQAALAMCRSEWHALHDNGIVPQKPKA